MAYSATLFLKGDVFKRYSGILLLFLKKQLINYLIFYTSALPVMHRTQLLTSSKLVLCQRWVLIRVLSALEMAFFISSFLFDHVSGSQIYLKADFLEKLLNGKGSSNRLLCKMLKCVKSKIYCVSVILHCFSLYVCIMHCYF